MKVYSVPKAPVFQPIEITITIETPDDLMTLRDFCYFSNTIPETFKKRSVDSGLTYGVAVERAVVIRKLMNELRKASGCHTGSEEFIPK